MNYIDILFLLVFAWSAYKGFTKGFVIAVASLIALLVGIFGAIRFSGFTAGWLKDQFELQSRHIDLIAFVITFILIIIGVHLIARLLDKLIEAVALGFVNRIAGVLFNLVKTAFIISVILVVLNKINEQAPFLPSQKIENSVFYKPLSALAPAIFPRLRFEYRKIREEFPSQDELVTENRFFYR